MVELWGLTTLIMGCCGCWGWKVDLNVSVSQPIQLEALHHFRNVSSLLISCCFSASVTMTPHLRVAMWQPGFVPLTLATLITAARHTPDETTAMGGCWYTSGQIYCESPERLRRPLLTCWGTRISPSPPVDHLRFKQC